jgi:hypothetical protein
MAVVINLGCLLFTLLATFSYGYSKGLHDGRTQSRR